MAKVFISHSSKDHYFVCLLVKLLKFHYIDTWCSSYDIQPGTQFPLVIEHAIKDANLLLVVTSENTIQSKWVTKEIAIFQTQNEEAVVVPLLLDSTNLDSIVPGLNYYQAIDFSQSMLEGCESLFCLLGKEFLSYKNRRNNPARRDSDERRTKDRRESTLIQRMRRGFWKSYYQSTGKGEFDELADSIYEKLKISNSLLSEASKYKYFDSANHEFDPKQVLEVVTHKVWNAMKDGRTFRPIYLIEGIAEEIYDHYRIERHFERRRDGRRLAEERRKKTSERVKT
jgi:hypothetical protein